MDLHRRSERDVRSHGGGRRRDHAHRGWLRDTEPVSQSDADPVDLADPDTHAEPDADPNPNTDPAARAVFERFGFDVLGEKR